MPTLLEKTNSELLAKREEMDKVFEKLMTDPDITDDDRSQFKTLETDVTKLHDRVKELEYYGASGQKNKDAITVQTTPVHPSRHGNPREGASTQIVSLSHDEIDRRRQKGIGDRVVEAPEFKGYRWGGPPAKVSLDDYEFKTTLAEATGFAPPNFRGSDVVPFALRRVVVPDLIPQVTTNGSAVKYMEETTNTNNAAGVAEGATKPEDAFVWTERTVLVEVIATTLPVTEQQLDDVPQIQGLINNGLGTHIMIAEENQILTGTGTSPQLQGFLTKTGVQTQAKGADPAPSAIFKAMTLVRYTGFAEPSGVVIHPTDWQNIRLLQDSTGRYIWGDPWVPGIERLWGVPVVQTPAETLGTALLGDFATYSYIARRMGLTIQVGYVNDNFAKNLRTIRAEIRLALVIRRPAAFAKVTGL
jgi:HK97 family phage major capsid protein